MITLYEKYEDCCGCGACLNICPKHAIKMVEKDLGSIYPEIDNDLCIECGLCKVCCNFKNKSNYSSDHIVYAATTKNENILMNSSSGGIFGTIAMEFIKDNGYVAGAVYDDSFNVMHVVSHNISDIIKMQGSKYVQSNIEFVYKEIQNLLKNNEKVLFSGTPCQVDGLYGFLQKDYDNLFTLDIVCHGVPSNSFFNFCIENNVSNKKEIKDIVFRDKNQGWGTLGKIELENKQLKFNAGNSVYYYLFNKGAIFRESCYKCKYASDKRPADITLGDFWGVEKVQPELLKQKNFDESKGISLIMCNTKKGKLLINNYYTCFNIKKSSYDKVSKYNHNLSNASIMPEDRLYFINLYRDLEYEKIKKHLNSHMRTESIMLYLKRLIPNQLKHYLKAYNKKF